MQPNQNIKENSMYIKEIMRNLNKQWDEVLWIWMNCQWFEVRMLCKKTMDMLIAAETWEGISLSLVFYVSVNWTLHMHACVHTCMIITCQRNESSFIVNLTWFEITRKKNYCYSLLKSKFIYELDMDLQEGSLLMFIYSRVY